MQAVDEDKFTKETHVWVVKKFVLKLKFICHLLSQASKSLCEIIYGLMNKFGMNVHDLKCDIIYGIVWKKIYCHHATRRSIMYPQKSISESIFV